jgi:hypothetical protein
LDAAAIRQLLDRGWTPPGVKLPEKSLDPEAVAAIIRITGGDFRLLNRLLTQTERILEINAGALKHSLAIRRPLLEGGWGELDHAEFLRSADSEGWRSAFRTDVDHDSEVMPISIPN